MRRPHIETSLFSRQRDALLTDNEFAALTVRLPEDPEAGTALGGSLFKLPVGVRRPWPLRRGARDLRLAPRRRRNHPARPCMPRTRKPT